MADKRPVWTAGPHEDGWENRREGSGKAYKVFDTKAEAQEAGRATAKRERVEHGNAPHPRRADPA